MLTKWIFRPMCNWAREKSAWFWVSRWKTINYCARPKFNKKYPKWIHSAFLHLKMTSKCRIYNLQCPLVLQHTSKKEEIQQEPNESQETDKFTLIWSRNFLKLREKNEPKIQQRFQQNNSIYHRFEAVGDSVMANTTHYFNLLFKPIFLPPVEWLPK